MQVRAGLQMDLGWCFCHEGCPGYFAVKIRFVTKLLEEIKGIFIPNSAFRLQASGFWLLAASVAKLQMQDPPLEEGAVVPVRFGEKKAPSARTTCVGSNFTHTTHYTTLHTACFFFLRLLLVPSGF